MFVLTDGCGHEDHCIVASEYLHCTAVEAARPSETSHLPSTGQAIHRSGRSEYDARCENAARRKLDGGEHRARVIRFLPCASRDASKRPSAAAERM